MMAQMQEKIKPVCAWSTFTGCTKSCSDFYGYDYSLPWISGITGFAFIINMAPDLCPSAPTSFNNTFLKKNAEILGLKFVDINFNKTDEDFIVKQKKAFKQIKKGLDKNQPAFGWELGIPEYYLITGTDESGYQYFDFDGSVKHCRWDSVATSDIGMAEFYILKKIKPASIKEQVKASLDFIQKYAENPNELGFMGYVMGNEAYDVWIKALQEGKYNPWGLAYNTQVWAEAKVNAYKYLTEVKARLGDKVSDPSLDNAIKQYQELAKAMSQNVKLIPFPPQGNIGSENLEIVIKNLNNAKEAESAGLKALLEYRKNYK